MFNDIYCLIQTKVVGDKVKLVCVLYDSGLNVNSI